MSVFRVSDSFKLASVWAVWGFLAIGALGWALFTVLCYFGVQGQAAAWVQAFGSVAAIAAAIAISHDSHQKELKRIQAAEAFEAYRVSELATQAIYECYLALERLMGQVYTPRVIGGRLNMARLVQSTEVLKMVLQQKTSVVTTAELFRALAHAAEVSVELDTWGRGVFPDNSDDYLPGHIGEVYQAYITAHNEFLYRAGRAGRYVDRRLQP